MSEQMQELSAEAARFGSPEYYIDSDSTEVQAFVTKALRDIAPDAPKKDKAVRLFQAVRDDVRYDPYTFSLNAENYRASVVAGMEAAFCVPKAILLAACLRNVCIPAALGFADVRNHLNTPKLAELMGTDLFIYHGYVQLWLGNAVFKVTPAFNMEMCHRFGVKPLEFDGEHDALFHEFDDRNRRHMEYVNDRGLFVDAPMERFLTEFGETYPKLKEFNQSKNSKQFFDESFAGPGGSPAK
jgi:transglutaminase-like putative cysteine protease